MRTQGGEAIHRLTLGVESQNPMTRLDEPPGHVKTHLAKTNEADVHIRPPRFQRSSCPHLLRASTPSLRKQDVDGRAKPAMTVCVGRSLFAEFWTCRILGHERAWHHGAPPDLSLRRYLRQPQICRNTAAEDCYSNT